MKRLWDQVFRATGIRVSVPERPLVVLDFETSGIDSGTIGYTIQDKRVRDLSSIDYRELLTMLDAAKVQIKAQRDGAS